MLSFFLLYLKKNLINYWNSYTLAGYSVSGLTGYPAGQSGIRPDTGYQKRPEISGRPDIRCIPRKNIFLNI
jgi:hypothetical protein